MGSYNRRHHRPDGFTLIEVVVVLLIFSVIIAMAAAITRGIAASQKRSLTVTRLALVDAALVQFVMQTKRLPCPADGRLPSAHASAGLEAARTATGCTDTTMQHGVVPWRTLGLTEGDATDAWDRRLTYRLQPALAGDAAMDMSWCDPAGSGPPFGTAQACKSDGSCASSTPSGLTNCTPPSAFLLNKGLPVRNIAGTVVMDPAGTPHTGAAYVVISHGETGGGGYLSSGNIAPSGVDGAAEARNYADKRYPTDTAYFVDDTLNENPGNAAPGPHFDDIVSRPGLLAVITRAGLGPRPH